MENFTMYVSLSWYSYFKTLESLWKQLDQLQDFWYKFYKFRWKNYNMDSIEWIRKYKKESYSWWDFICLEINSERKIIKHISIFDAKNYDYSKLQELIDREISQKRLKSTAFWVSAQQNQFVEYLEQFTNFIIPKYNQKYEVAKADEKYIYPWIKPREKYYIDKSLMPKTSASTQDILWGVTYSRDMAKATDTIQWTYNYNKNTNTLEKQNEIVNNKKTILF